jgi:SAM-dependent methyltransferase
MTDLQAISKGLKLGEDGIWYSIDTQPIYYPAEGNDAYFGIEDISFWFRHRNNCITAIVKEYPPEEGGTIFDIGGGNGFVSLGLKNSGYNVTLVEPGQSGALNAKRRGINTVICATTDSAQFKPHSLSAIGLFDVIEHIEDDVAFLKSLHKLIKPGGRLYATVPAYPFLWSDEDVSAGHFKRYTLKSIHSVLEASGFEVEFSTYIFSFLPIPIAFMRMLPYRMGISKSGTKIHNIPRDHAVKIGGTSRILEKLLSSEVNKLKKNSPIWFGSSCLVVVRVPEKNQLNP